MSHPNQDTLNTAQEAYRTWLGLQPKLQEAVQAIKQSAKQMAKLNDFYENDYRHLYEAREAGENLDLTTQGEYSVLSEDAIWNAMHEHDSDLWAILRTSMQALDEARPDFGYDCDEDECGDEDCPDCDCDDSTDA